MQNKNSKQRGTIFYCRVIIKRKTPYWGAFSFFYLTIYPKYGRFMLKNIRSLSKASPTLLLQPIGTMLARCPAPFIVTKGSWTSIMTKSLAAQYRGSAFVLTARLEELKALLLTEKDAAQRHTIEKRIDALVEERRSLLSIASYLEEYYEEKPAQAPSAAV